jgi:hypothetical protein
VSAPAFRGAQGARIRSRHFDGIGVCLGGSVARSVPLLIPVGFATENHRFVPSPVADPEIHSRDVDVLPDERVTVPSVHDVHDRTSIKATSVDS